jgi:hypothetical protein
MHRFPRQSQPHSRAASYHQQESQDEREPGHGELLSDALGVNHRAFRRSHLLEGVIVTKGWTL